MRAHRSLLLALAPVAVSPGLGCTAPASERAESRSAPILGGTPVPSGRADSRRIMQVATNQSGTIRECTGVLVSNAWRTV